MAEAKNSLKIQMVDLVAQHSEYKSEMDEAMQRVLSHGAFINGPEVKTFAAGLAGFLGTKYVIPCANGTDAIQIALMALGLQPGDEVITTSFNYVAAAEACTLLGLKPAFAEAGGTTFNLDADILEGYITPKTKAIIAVHLFGQACDMEKVMTIAEKHNLFVIEDNAQSLGTDLIFEESRKKAGTAGHIGTTSFFPTKNLGCLGDGGAVFTNDELLAEICRSISAHGQGQRYEFQRTGINSRLDTLQAALLNVKLNRLEESLQKRAQAAALYARNLAGSADIHLPETAFYTTHTWNQFVIRVKENRRDDLKKFLGEKGIPTMVYYPKPLHLQPAFSYLGYKQGDFPVSEQLCSEVLALPVHPVITEEQILYITHRIKEFFNAH